MNARTLVQLVAALVVLGILVRWIPLDPSEAAGDWLGRGEPVRQLAVDATVATLRADDGRARGLHADRALLRPLQVPGMPADRARRLRQKWLRRVDELHAQSRSDASAELPVAQAKGVVRNDYWLLMYDLYPIPLHGTWFEDGGRPSDATEPGAVVFEYADVGGR